MGIVIPLVMIVVTCLVIWRACNGFEVASRYLGRNLSDGVRGGTINAISSSVPELMTTLIALFVLADEDGFAVGLGTTAGSALFNGMIIPAACIFAVVGTVIAGRRVTSVDVSSKVVLRDGLMLLGVELVMIVLINGQQLHWWQGLLLILLYGVYFAYMWATMGASSNGVVDPHALVPQPLIAPPERRGGIWFFWVSGGPLLDLEHWMIRDRHRQQIREESWNAWPLLLVSVGFIALACWLLVVACEWLGTGPGNLQHPYYELFGYRLQGLGMPPIFVAVIFASMATSVPDTVMSVRDARAGDYDDAVANALGSNIFDICFALGLPLLLYTLLQGPIDMPRETVLQSGEMRILLFLLTAASFAVFYAGPRRIAADGSLLVQMNRGAAVALLLAYGMFVAYIVGITLEWAWAEWFSSLLRVVLEQLPRIG